ncbi:hypothetical protein FOCC_FOCC014835 [Frankliniella occidentalis]|nr:hypothetical protein FOCC_FOCC014835 [Frankliniella occidentalis]
MKSTTSTICTPKSVRGISTSSRQSIRITDETLTQLLIHFERANFPEGDFATQKYAELLTCTKEKDGKPANRSVVKALVGKLLPQGTAAVTTTAKKPPSSRGKATRQSSESSEQVDDVVPLSEEKRVIDCNRKIEIDVSNPTPRKAWELRRLVTDQDLQDSYAATLDALLTEQEAHARREFSWRQLVDALRTAADGVLATPPDPQTPRRQAAANATSAALTVFHRAGRAAYAADRLRAARAAQRAARDQHQMEQQGRFFATVTGTRPAARMHVLFRHLWVPKRTPSTRGAAGPTIQDWQRWADGLEDGEPVPVLAELPDPGAPAPTAAQLAGYAKTLSNNTARARTASLEYCSNSKSVITALQRRDIPPYEPPELTKLRESINKITGRKQIWISWVPAHKGVLPNEHADIAAKIACTMGVPHISQQYNQNYFPSIRQYFLQEWQQQRTVAATATKPVGKFNYLLDRDLKTRTWISLADGNLERKFLTPLLRTRMGHTHAPASLHRFNQTVCPLCDRCAEEATTTHIINDCLFVDRTTFADYLQENDIPEPYTIPHILQNHCAPEIKKIITAFQMLLETNPHIKWGEKDEAT